MPVNWSPLISEWNEIDWDGEVTKNTTGANQHVTQVLLVLLLEEKEWKKGRVGLIVQ